MATDSFSFAKAKELSVVNEWDISDRQLYTYIDEAREKFKLCGDMDAKEEYKKAIARCLSMYNEAYTAGNIKTALEVHKELSKLLGLYPSA